jgi:hypothetical protein
MQSTPQTQSTPCVLSLISFGTSPSGVSNELVARTDDRPRVDPAQNPAENPAVAAGRHTLPVTTKRARRLRTAEVGTSDQRNHVRGWDRRCGSPLYPEHPNTPSSFPIDIGAVRRAIGSGLFYLGDALTMPDARVIDQYAVNPDLSVSSGRGTRQAVVAVLSLVCVDHSCVGDRAVNPTGFWYYAASFGITLSTNRKNRLFRAPATTDSCETPIPGTDIPFRRDRVLHVPATKKTR